MTGKYNIRPGSPRDRDFKNISQGILRSLKKHGAGSPTKIAEWANRDPKTIGLYLPRLLKEGAISRIPNPNYWHYYVTEDEGKKEPALKLE